MGSRHLWAIRSLTLISFVILSISVVVQADDREADNDIELLRQAAQSQINEEEVGDYTPEETIFKAGGLGLQSLNPEISVTGDIFWNYRNQQDVREKSRFIFRGLGIHLESYLDPYSRFKAAVPINAGGAELGEAYYTRFGLFGKVNLTLGKFRQQFGVVNRWHKHGLDQFDFPLALRKIFGEGGLNQTGISVDLTMPGFGESAQEMTLQITNGENGRMFGENERNMPAVLAHYKNYLDLSASTYIEIGLTGLAGWNDRWTLSSGPTIDYGTKTAAVLGLDLTLLWEPADRMRYRNMVFRSEAYYVDKEILAPDGSGNDRLNPWGAYAYFEEKVSRTLIAGVRADYYCPDTKNYADTPGLPLDPLAVSTDDTYYWQVGPYITWHQSPFVHFRLEYNHQGGRHAGDPEDAIMLQSIFAAGPHKHERY